MGAMIRKMKSGDTLTDPGKLWDLANAATQALTVDTGIGSVDRLTELAQELARVDPKNISFVTLPVVDNPNETVKAIRRPRRGPGPAAPVHAPQRHLAHRV